MFEYIVVNRFMQALLTLGDVYSGRRRAAEPTTDVRSPALSNNFNAGARHSKCKTMQFFVQIRPNLNYVGHFGTNESNASRGFLQKPPRTENLLATTLLTLLWFGTFMYYYLRGNL